MFSKHTNSLPFQSLQVWKYCPTFCLFSSFCKNNLFLDIFVYLEGTEIFLFLCIVLQSLFSPSPIAFRIVSRARLSLDGKTSFSLRLHCYMFVVEYQYLSYWNSLERQGAAYLARIFAVCSLHPSSFHSKRQSSCWYLSYTQVSKYKRTSGRCSCMDSNNMGKQCFPIVCENGVARTFVLGTPSNLFLQRKPCFRTFPRVLSFAPLAHPCTLCSASKYRQSCDTCKTSIVGSASPQLLLLRNVASPFFWWKTLVFGISDFGKIHRMETNILPFLERCTTFVRYRSLVVCIQHAAKKK